MTESEPGRLTEIEAALVDLGLKWTRHGNGFTVTLPGTHKLSTDCTLELGRHTLQVRAFVARKPEQDAERVYAWLLQRNLKLVGVAFGLDHLGDIYLLGRLPSDQVSAAAVNRLLGVLAETADTSFDPIVALGFADSIAREWAWRRARGESVANLAAFVHLDPNRTTG